MGRHRRELASGWDLRHVLQLHLPTTHHPNCCCIMEMFLLGPQQRVLQGLEQTFCTASASTGQDFTHAVSHLHQPQPQTSLPGLTTSSLPNTCPFCTPRPARDSPKAPRDARAVVWQPVSFTATFPHLCHPDIRNSCPSRLHGGRICVGEGTVTHGHWLGNRGLSRLPLPRVHAWLVIHRALNPVSFSTARNPKPSRHSCPPEQENSTNAGPVTSARVLGNVSHDKTPPGLRPAAKSSTDPRSLYACLQPDGAPAGFHTLHHPKRSQVSLLEPTCTQEQSQHCRFRVLPVT